MRRRRSLHAQIMRWLRAYAVLLAVVISLFLADEVLEERIWGFFLEQEITQHLERKAADPDYRWQDTESVRLYSLPGRPPPPALSALPYGVRDDFWFDDHENVVLVQRVQGVDFILVRDITELKALEEGLILSVLGLAVALLLVMGVLVARGLRRSLQPLSDLAGDISALSPDQAEQRVVVEDHASSELHVIANALNDYLYRQDAFVERERVFNNTASHELRTPIAVIAGAIELVLEKPDLPPTAREQMRRALDAARNVEQLIALLLTLAKDPARLARSNDTLRLHELLPDIIDAHHHLLHDKALEIVVDDLAPCVVEAPLHLVQAAIGNLLRNAIENSDRGRILVTLDADATVTIEDPGHGMTPAEISRIYKQIARGGRREGGGIGLDLLGRLCDHLGWSLSISSRPGRGTLSRLRLSDHRTVTAGDGR
ncbi:MAG: HAMP domain-containing sensor histidine kinase [Lysobacteraceae bacterium]|uniref:sensor histidine kinase n=1 Tax=Denitratimonas sp. CY0512 TaxID=3131940 RepID=UPI0030A70ACA